MASKMSQSPVSTRQNSANRRENNRNIFCWSNFQLNRNFEEIMFQSPANNRRNSDPEGPQGSHNSDETRTTSIIPPPQNIRESGRGRGRGNGQNRNKN